jgi:molybdopterin-guanine dinucleotide biosynthesis protein A
VTPAGGLDLVVLAGGGSRRWGGGDKTAQPLGGVPVLIAVLESALRALGGGGTPSAVVVVAPAGHPARDAVHRLDLAGAPLVWTLEDPPDGGPVAGLAAALGAATGQVAPGAVVAVVAGDAPFAGTALPRLVAALADGDDDAAVGVDGTGRRQLLFCARRAALGAALRSGPDGGRPRAVHRLLGALGVVEVPLTDRESLDLDVPADLVRARALLDRPG